MKHVITDALCRTLFGIMALSIVGCDTGEYESLEDQADVNYVPIDEQAPLRGSPTGARGFGEVGILSDSKGRKLCSGTLILPDAILTTSQCARQRPTHFSNSSQANRVLPSWRGNAKVLPRFNEAPQLAEQDESEGLAVVYLERTTSAPRVEAGTDLPVELGQQLWLAGFGANGERFSPFSHRTRRYAGAQVLHMTANTLVLELEAAALGCKDDVGAGVFSEDESGKRWLVGVVTRIAANPGDSEQPRGCSRRVEALRVQEQKEWLQGIASCPCRCGRGVDDDSVTS